MWRSPPCALLLRRGASHRSRDRRVRETVARSRSLVDLVWQHQRQARGNLRRKIKATTGAPWKLLLSQNRTFRPRKNPAAQVAGFSTTDKPWDLVSHRLPAYFKQFLLKIAAGSGATRSSVCV